MAIIWSPYQNMNPLPISKTPKPAPFFMTRDPVIRSERLKTLVESLRGIFEVTVRGTDENLGVQIS